MKGNWFECTLCCVDSMYVCVCAYECICVYIDAWCYSWRFDVLLDWMLYTKDVHIRRWWCKWMLLLHFSVCLMLQQQQQSMQQLLRKQNTNRSGNGSVAAVNGLCKMRLEIIGVHRVHVGHLDARWPVVILYYSTVQCTVYEVICCFDYSNDNTFATVNTSKSTGKSIAKKLWRTPGHKCACTRECSYNVCVNLKNEGICDKQHRQNICCRCCCVHHTVTHCVYVWYPFCCLHSTVHQCAHWDWCRFPAHATSRTIRVLLSFIRSCLL